MPGPARCTKAPVHDGGLRLGYACVNTGLPSSGRTVRLANATPDRLRELIAGNLEALETILRWNAEHSIEVFRVTSNFIPFGSHPVNRSAWWDEFGERFAEIGARAGRLSTHPGQYTILSSVNPSVVDAAVAELEYHNRLLDSFGLGPSHKIVLHVGSTDRFEAGFARLSEGTRSRLVLENDERYPLTDVLPLAERVDVPVVFDVIAQHLNAFVLAVDPSGPVQLTGSDASGQVVATGSVGGAVSAPSPADAALEDGRHFGYVRSVDPEAGTIEFDLAYFLSGKQADQAYQEATGDTGHVPNDHFVVNDNPLLRTLTLAPDARLRLLDWNHCCETFFDGDLSLFAQAIEQQSDVTDGDLVYRGQSQWWVTVENGVVTEIEEQYSP